MPAMLSGLSVLTPAAWWSLLALAIPVLIHLFSRSRGRLVRIGHIDLIRQARRVKVTELRLTQWLLLLLRLLIFTLATLMLAGLVTAGLESSNAATVYLAPGWVETASGADKDAIFEARENDPETRFFLLQPGFPKADRRVLDDDTSSPGPGSDDAGDSWSLLAERLSLERHRGPVTVYATDRVLQYGRDKPTLPAEIDWRISHPAPAPIQRPDGIHALLVYDGERAAEVRIFDAAFSALKTQRLPGLLWETIESGQFDEPPPGTDWLILLGKQAPDLPRLARRGSPLVILSEAAGEGELATGLYRLPFFPFSEFRVNRVSPTPPSAPGQDDPADREVLLSGDGAAPLLQQSRAGRVRLLQFNSRFDPRWSSLAEQPEFPELLVQLMLDPDQDIRRFSDARIDPAGLATSVPAPASETPLPHRSLQGLLAILLVILWAGERWLCERRTRERS